MSMPMPMLMLNTPELVIFEQIASFPRHKISLQKRKPLPIFYYSGTETDVNDVFSSQKNLRELFFSLGNIWILNNRQSFWNNRLNSVTVISQQECFTRFYRTFSMEEKKEDKMLKVKKPKYVSNLTQLGKKMKHSLL